MLIWVKRKNKGHLAHWKTISNHPEFTIQAVDGSPLANVLYSASFYDSSLQAQKHVHLGSASTLELAKNLCEKKDAAL